MDYRAHWEAVYETTRTSEESWYQPQPSRSLELLARIGIGPTSRIIDIGGGDSTLVDSLIERQLGHVTVLDISATALERARARLGSRSREATWIEADVTRASLPLLAFDVWHDRAVFHFLTDARDRRRYVDLVHRSLRTGGHLIIATFALDGPTHCSGLAVGRYSPETLLAALGPGFELISHVREVHRTPAGKEQAFIYACCEKR